LNHPRGAFGAPPQGGATGGPAEPDPRRPLGNSLRHSPSFDASLLSRIEDAGLNASAPPQQRWIDGWLVRFSPGKAKRARCVNAVAAGRLPLVHKLALAQAVFDEAQLPAVVRITPFSQPPDLDAQLRARGWQRIDDTRVMVRTALDSLQGDALPAGLSWQVLGHSAFAQAVGQLRRSPLSQSQAHAQRLELSPVPFRALAIRREADGALLACGQFAREADLVGLYDVFTAQAERGQGLAGRLCARLLAQARDEGARSAYLQVEGDNHAARNVYRRLGFADAYAYHYRMPASAHD
jgi:GNAT superfamily N-acetyltransferase